MFFFALFVFLVLLCFPKQATPKRDLSAPESGERSRSGKSWEQGGAEEGEGTMLIVCLLHFDGCGSHVAMGSWVREQS